MFNTNEIEASRKGNARYCQECFAQWEKDYSYDLDGKWFKVCCNCTNRVEVKRRSKGTGITPSQQKQIDLLKTIAAEWNMAEITITEDSILGVIFQARCTEAFSRARIGVAIGRRGGVKCLTRGPIKAHDAVRID